MILIMGEFIDSRTIRTVTQPDGETDELQQYPDICAPKLSGIWGGDMWQPSSEVVTTPTDCGE